MFLSFPRALGNYPRGGIEEEKNTGQERILKEEFTTEGRGMDLQTKNRILEQRIGSRNLLCS